MAKRLKVFHGLVNYGTQAGLFANELRNLGIDAICVTNADKFKRQTDFELFHGGPFLIKLFKHFYNTLFKLYCFFKYNTFHFYYGKTLFQKQIDLPFYRIFGKKVIMEYLGNDIQRYQLSVDKYKWTNMTFMMTPEEGKRRDQKIENRFNFEKRYIDKMLVCAPVYSEFIPNVELLPLAIDLKQYQYATYPEFKGTYRILHAPTHRGFKGTDFIIQAINDLKSDGFKIDLILAENITHTELKEEYKKCHLFIDQIMGGWYGTATIEAMAIGRPVIVSLREEYFKYTNFSRDEIPLLHADPDNVLNVIKSSLENGLTFLRETGIECCDFVKKNHDFKKLTVKLLNHY